MNSCKIDIIKSYNRNPEGTAEAVSKVNGASVEDVKKEINGWMNSESNSSSSNPNLFLRDFFLRSRGSYENVAYNRIKQDVKAIIISWLFNNGQLPLTNSDLNTRLKYKIDEISKKYTKDALTNISYRMSSDDFNFIQNKDAVIDYLIINHLDMIANSWLSDLIECKNGNFSYNPKHDIRKDWDSEKHDMKEPDLSAILGFMLATTKIHNFDGLDIVEGGGDYYATKTSFQMAAARLFADLTYDQRMQVMQNPYSLIDLMMEDNFWADKFGLEYNILKSFINEWVFEWTINGIEKKNFYEQSIRFKNLREKTFSPLDVFLHSFIKYSLQSYAEIDAKGDIGILGVTKGFIGDIYMMTCKNLDDNLKTIIGNVEKDADYYVKTNNSGIQELTNHGVDFCQSILGFDADPRLVSNLINALKEYSKSSKPTNGEKTFYNYLKNNAKYESEFRSMINSAYKANPTIILGSQNNKLAKALPAFGIETVAADIYKTVINNEIRKEELNFKGKAIYEEGFLFKDLAKNPEDRIYYDTVYPNTISVTDSDGVEHVKDTNNLSTIEAFMLQYQTGFKKSWDTSSGHFMIQAITPSDKPKIPWFRFDVKKFKYKYCDKEGQLKRDIIHNEILNIYKRHAVNVINSFKFLDKNIAIPDNVDVNSLSQNELSKKIDLINSTLALLLESNKDKYYLNGKIQTSAFIDDLNLMCYRYNQKNNENLMISQYNDYVISGNMVIINPFIMNQINRIGESNYFISALRHDLKDLSEDIDIWEFADTKIDKSIDDMTDDDISTNFGSLLDYLYIQSLCSENILVNTVGLPFAHKSKVDNIEDWDSVSHTVMVKRMAALTATSHNMMRSVLNGMPSSFRTIAFKSKSNKHIFVHSGKSVSGDKYEGTLDLNDGVIQSTRISDNLAKASIGDVQPDGNAIKYICHDYRPDKGGSRFVKCASNSIDNAYIRAFSYGTMDSSDPESFIKIQLHDAIIDRSISSNENGDLVDFNGNKITISQRFIKDGEIYRVSNFKWDGDKITYQIQGPDRNKVFNKINSDLYSIWKALGGAWSCKDREYDESSMDVITELVNRIGKKKINNGDVHSQDDVDQYLKKQLIMFFTNDTTEKALQTMYVDMDDCLRSLEEQDIDDLDNNRLITTELSCANFGIQLDPNHEIVGAKIHEITQMMSYLAEKSLVPEKTSRVYKNIVSLVDILQSKTFIDISDILDVEKRAIYREKLNNIFKKKVIDAFSDPKLDVLTAANEICRQLKDLNEEFEPPYSDHQILMKMHTLVGSYFNKFIAREWTGTGDVLMASSGLALIMEDENGQTYMASDDKIIFENGIEKRINIKKYLSDKRQGVLDVENSRDTSWDVSKYELEPYMSYYVIRNGVIAYDEFDEPEMITIGNFEDLQNIIESNDDIIYVKALDKPRNLKTASRILSWNEYVETIDENGDLQIVKVGRKANLWSFKSQRALLQCKKDNASKQIRDARQREFQHTLSILSKIANNKELSEQDIEHLENEFDGIKFQDNDVEFIFNPDERLGTNYIGGLYGDNKMNLSEIQQRGYTWFLENLKKRCLNIDFSEHTLGKAHNNLLYTSNGNAISVITEVPHDLNFNNLTKISPSLDEDGYVVNSESGMRYKLPDGAQLYEATVNGRKITVVITNEAGLVEIAKSKSFVFGKNIELENFPVTTISSDADYEKVAKQQYEAFKQSLIHMVSRIPAQSMNFGMSMKTVGFLPWNNNVSMVNDIHVYLEGSDYDIDKIYVMSLAMASNGFSINERFNNIYITKSHISDITEESSIGNGLVADLVYKKFATMINENGEEISLLSDVEYNALYDETVNKLLELLKGSDISISIDDIYELVSQNIKYGSKRRFIKREIRKIINSVASEARWQNATAGSGSISGIQNMILGDILSIYSDPAITIAATTPTTMEPVQSAVEASGEGKKKRFHHSITTNMRINKTCIVGKAGVGITANGQKAAYAIEYYHSWKNQHGFNMYSDYVLPVAQEFGIKDHAYFMPPNTAINKETYSRLLEMCLKKNHVHNIGQYNLKLIGQKVGVGDVYEYLEYLSAIRSSLLSEMQLLQDYDKDSLMLLVEKIEEAISAVNSIARSDNPKIESKNKQNRWNRLNQYRIELNSIASNNSFNENINNIIGGLKLSLQINNETVGVGSIVKTDSPTDIISSLISSCTDNAKEMKIDLLNGSEETLSGYVYLLMIGMSLEYANKILGHKIVKKLVNMARGNYYGSDFESQKIGTIISNMVKGGVKNEKLISFAASFGYEAEDMLDMLKTLKHVFDGARVLTTLSNILGINGGIDVTFGSAILYKHDISSKINLGLDDNSKVDVYRFVSDPTYDYQYYIDNYGSDSKPEQQLFNILDIISSVDHYGAMLKVPFEFDKSMRALSSDYNSVAMLCDELIKKGYIISTERDVRRVAAYINQKKIKDFLISIDFEFIDTVDGEDLVLNINTSEGLTKFKKYVEKRIYPQIKKLKDRYPNNMFINNLCKDEVNSYLHKEKYEIIKTRLSLSNTKEQDIILSIKDEFRKIKDETIEGHSVYDWLYLYNLIVNPNPLSKSSMSSLFDVGLDLTDDESLISKWTKFINDYDKNIGGYFNFSKDINELGFNHKGEKSDQEADDTIILDIDLLDHLGVSYAPSYNTSKYIDPDELPLFISKDELGIDTLYRRRDVINAFRSGILTLKHC